MKRLLNATAVVVASALLLAGCGGGSDDDTMDTPPVVNEPTEPEETASDLALSVYKAADDAMDAGTKAAADAKKYAGMLSALHAKGESATAIANAQMVFDTQTTLTNAITVAKTAVAEARAALAGASAEDMALLNAAITDGEADIKAAETSLLAVNIQVDTIDGTKAKPKTAADRGKDVATEVATALNEATLTSPAPDTPGMSTAAMPTVYRNNSKDGKTWAQIVASMGKTIVSMPLAADNAARKVVSIATEAIGGEATTITGGDEGTPVTYMGIQGTAWCLGEATACTVSAGKAPAKVYFMPTANERSTYVRHDASTGMTGYMQEMNTEYGYWLSEDDGALGVTVFATGPAQQSPALGVNVTNSNASATYNGSAVGMSVLNSVDGNSKVTNEASGHFDANVRLTAKFGPSPTLEGMVNNFRGNAIGSGWTVTLGSTALNASGELANDGQATGNAAGGMWEAKSFGEDSMRPEGFFGRFNADFTNGSVIGAYVAEK